MDHYTSQPKVLNRIDKVFLEKKNILNIYFTAGYPKLEDTIKVAEALQKGGADMLEIGIPFSDPIADGPTIQKSSMVALDNGMTLATLFSQLTDLRERVEVPVLFMGYINPILQFGIEEFCVECQRVGIDGLILPDLPMKEYLEEYQVLFEKHGLHNIFLISPNTHPERIKQIDNNSSGFVYMVSSSSITGAKLGIADQQVAYFERIKAMNLINPRLIGFGISNKETFQKACDYANGAIIGSAFVNQLGEDASEEAIVGFVKKIRG